MSNKTKPNKPYKLDSEKYSGLIKVYVTDEQKNWIESLKNQSNEPSMSNFVRNIIIKSSVNEQILIQTERPISKDLERKISGMANNVNQAMNAFHMLGNINDLHKISQEMNEARQVLAEMKALISSNVDTAAAPLIPVPTKTIH